ncbi:hypothetical protein V8E51_003345 [Hyaloscypha variabilis]
MTDIKQNYEIGAFDAPHSYDDIQRALGPYSSAAPSQISTSLNPVSSASYSHSDSFKPIVIPQAHSFSPFSRAYSPLLAQNSISQEEFLTFLDGLNEAFIAAPAFQVASHVGNAGMGLAVGAGLASTATSWTRARAFVKTANKEMFSPNGLKCKVLKTKKMMVVVGHGEEVLRLPPLEILDEETAAESEDPRLRRIRALGDRVAPLKFDGLPDPEELDNWWKRMGSKSAQKKDAKMQKKLMKGRAEGAEKFDEKTSEAEKEARKYDKELMKVERERQKEVAKAEKKLSGKKGQDPEKRAEIEYELEKETRKLDKERNKVLREKAKKVGEKSQDADKELQKSEKKEHKVAQKIYWIVIDKAELLDDEVGVEDDVESLDSK